MSDLRKAAQMAMEALEVECYAPGDGPILTALVTLRAALAKPEQEPVAVLLEYENGERELRFKNNGWPAKETPLYTHLPRRKWRGLTDEIIDSVWPSPEGTNSIRALAYAIEGALKEKNHD